MLGQTEVAADANEITAFPELPDWKTDYLLKVFSQKEAHALCGPTGIIAKMADLN